MFDGSGGRSSVQKDVDRLVFIQWSWGYLKEGDEYQADKHIK